MRSVVGILGRAGVVVALGSAACGSDPGAPSTPPVNASARDAGAEASRPPPPPPADEPDAGVPDPSPPCAAPPCAARPVVFVHGFTGSNDDWVPILDAISTTDARWNGYQLVGTEEHQSWGWRIFDRKKWLFAFDYYLKKNADGRGSYTAGPGRVGTNPKRACTSPQGTGDIVPDSGDYYDGATHSYAADLASFIEDVLLATGASKVDIVAHSMGGLVARSYLAFLGGNVRVERMLLLASPVRGVDVEGLLAYFPISHESWMNAHEVAELDGGSFATKIRFSLCGETSAAGAFGAKILEQENLRHPGAELYVMSGQNDLFITYDVADHPLALSHDVVPGVTHSGILKAQMTIDHVRTVAGGTK